MQEKQVSEEWIEKTVQTYYPLIFSFLYSLCKDQALSQDLCQETLIRWVRSLKEERYEEQGKLKSYLFSIAVHAFHDQKRKEKNWVEYDEQLHEDLSLDGALWFEQHQNQLILQKWIDQLKNPQKEVIVLHALEQFTFEETAAILAVPVSTVKSRYARALCILKEFAQKEWDESERR